jgi:hypothetical protein
MLMGIQLSVGKTKNILGIQIFLGIKIRPIFVGIQIKVNVK